jgi:carbon-monoxide dehydrogenase small subunit
MLVASVALLDSTPNPSDDEIRGAISGNLCRCTGYVRIVRAIGDAAQAGQSAKR